MRKSNASFVIGGSSSRDEDDERDSKHTQRRLRNMLIKLWRNYEARNPDEKEREGFRRHRFRDRDWERCERGLRRWRWAHESHNVSKSELEVESVFATLAAHQWDTGAYSVCWEEHDLVSFFNEIFTYSSTTHDCLWVLKASQKIHRLGTSSQLFKAISQIRLQHGQSHARNRWGATD